MRDQVLDPALDPSTRSVWKSLCIIAATKFDDSASACRSEKTRVECATRSSRDERGGMTSLPGAWKIQVRTMIGVSVVMAS